MALPVEKVSSRYSVAVAIHVGPNNYELVSVRVGQGSDQDRVNDGVDGGGGADADHQRGDDGGRHAGAAAESAKTVAKVPEESAQGSPLGVNKHVAGRCGLLKALDLEEREWDGGVRRWTGRLKFKKSNHG